MKWNGSSSFPRNVSCFLAGSGYLAESKQHNNNSTLVPPSHLEWCVRTFPLPQGVAFGFGFGTKGWFFAKTRVHVLPILLLLFLFFTPSLSQLGFIAATTAATAFLRAQELSNLIIIDQKASERERQSSFLFLSQTDTINPILKISCP